MRDGERAWGGGRGGWGRRVGIGTSLDLGGRDREAWVDGGGLGDAAEILCGGGAAAVVLWL